MNSALQGTVLSGGWVLSGGIYSARKIKKLDPVPIMARWLNTGFMHWIGAI